MRKLIVTALLLVVGTGSAMADRGGRGARDTRTVVRDNRTTTRDTRTVVRDNRSPQRDTRTVVRDNRGSQRDNRVVVRDNRSGWNNNNRTVVRDNRSWNNNRVVRQPVYVNNNRYSFGNGRTFYYQRPVIQYRYTNYRVRPSFLIENYETVPGYIWVAGNWQWNGYEWLWISGHYEVDAQYNYDAGYDGY